MTTPTLTEERVGRFLAALATVVNPATLDMAARLAASPAALSGTPQTEAITARLLASTISVAAEVPAAASTETAASPDPSRPGKAADLPDGHPSTWNRADWLIYCAGHGVEPATALAQLRAQAERHRGVLRIPQVFHLDSIAGDELLAEALVAIIRDLGRAA